ncbi:glycosyltransferase [Clostridium bowmanii]|uniref:glycosyltransferase n=1 Tax=Clostridium bowmanii TaxID=132925 RepID=UPI001C0DF84F|nr:glycosyltransferase [Clostridium bowmanii]MBU3191228.1 glycosyltransferase [Clostridium bowmanii]MCA1075676.1 glycosyltransferase [Clostridium bowmanii]
MSKEIKISVIIPVYNTQEYVRKCIESVLLQSLEDIEIIIVDDGSTDNSLSIIKEYAGNDKVILISKENEGQGAARNDALDVCSGKYIAFLDSDDYIEKNMFEDMYLKANKYDLDILICKYRWVDTKGIEIIGDDIEFVESEIIDSDKCIKEFFTSNTIGGFSWNKIFHSRLFKEENIRYPTNMKYEDIPTVFDLIINSNRIGFTNNKYYYYVQRPGSTTNDLSVKNMKDHLLAVEMIGDILKKRNLVMRHEGEYQYYFLNNILDYYGFNYSNKDNIQGIKFEVIKNEFKSLIKTHYTKFVFNKYFSSRQIIKILIMRFNVKQRKKLK